MTRRSAVTAYLAGQTIMALVLFGLVATAPDRGSACLYIITVALLSLAVTAVYAVTGALAPNKTVVTIDPVTVARPIPPDAIVNKINADVRKARP